MWFKNQRLINIQNLNSFDTVANLQEDLREKGYLALCKIFLLLIISNLKMKTKTYYCIDEHAH